MSSNDFIYLFQVLFGNFALGLFGVVFALLVWDAGVTMYRRRKWEVGEISIDDLDDIPQNEYELQELTT